MVDGDGRELVERKPYYVQQFDGDGEVGPWNVGRWEGGYGWTVLGDRIGFGVVKIGSRVPMPGEINDVATGTASGTWVRFIPNERAGTFSFGDERLLFTPARVPMPDEEPDEVYVEDCHDGLVTLWHDTGGPFAELTPPQARTLAARLVEMAGEIEARDTPADEPVPDGGPKPSLRMAWIDPVGSDLSATTLILPAFVRGVSCRAVVPAGTSGCGTFRFDPDGEPREFVVDGRSYPFVPDTLSPVPESDQPACLDDHPQYGKGRS